ncbi:MAG TPA: hypothetical protein VFF79_19670 [Conexibacter sp.]|jgi:hypothetical protein|nr:hypothetical protein [Conexibacter sp.]
MSQVSRPVQILLAVTLLFGAVWFVALRPKSGDGGASAPAAASAQTTPAAPGVQGLKRAIDKAQGAVATASGDAQRAAQSSADGTGAGGAGTSGAAPGGAGAATGTAGAGGSATAGAGTGSPAAAPPASGQVAAVRAALRRHEAVAIAFVDTSTADARAVAQELAHVSRFDGRAVVLAVPLAKLSDYPFITNAVEVTVAPTIVIVDRRGRASTIVGFADRGEIEQRLADALAVTPKR